MTDGELIFPDSISKMFHVSKKTLYRKAWRVKNGMPLRKVGGRLCASRHEIEKWFKGLNG